MMADTTTTAAANGGSGGNNSNGGGASPASPRTQLRALMEEVDPRYMLSPEVEEFCVLFAEDFIDKVASLSSRIATLRRSNVLERRDVAFCLEKNFGLKVFPTRKTPKAINSKTLSTGANINIVNIPSSNPSNLSVGGSRHASRLSSVRAAKHQSQQQQLRRLQQQHHHHQSSKKGAVISTDGSGGSALKKKKKSKTKTIKKV